MKLLLLLCDDVLAGRKNYNANVDNNAAAATTTSQPTTTEAAAVIDSKQKTTTAITQQTISTCSTPWSVCRNFSIWAVVVSQSVGVHMVVAGVANSRTSKTEINKQQRILCAELSSSGFLQQQHKLLKLNQNNSNNNKKRHHPTSKCDVKNTPQFIETLIENSDKKTQWEHHNRTKWNSHTSESVLYIQWIMQWSSSLVNCSDILHKDLI